MRSAPSQAGYWLAYHREHPALHDETPVIIPPGHPLYSGPVGRVSAKRTKVQNAEPPEPTLFYAGIPLDGSVEDMHRALIRLEKETVPETYYRKVVAGKLANRRLDRKQPHDRAA